MKYLILLVLATLLLVSCTANTSDQEHINQIADQVIEDTDSSSDTQEIEVPVVEEKTETVEADITIVNGKLQPTDISIPIDEETTLTIHNLEDTSVRFEIPLYGSEVSVDIDSNQYDIVTLTPKNKGFVQMEVNGVGVGTLQIK